MQENSVNQKSLVLTDEKRRFLVYLMYGHLTFSYNSNACIRYSLSKVLNRGVFYPSNYHSILVFSTRVDAAA